MTVRHGVLQLHCALVTKRITVFAEKLSDADGAVMELLLSLRLDIAVQQLSCFISLATDDHRRAIHKELPLTFVFAIGL